jgi:hypothetical protein
MRADVAAGASRVEALRPSSATASIRAPAAMRSGATPTVRLDAGPPEATAAPPMRNDTMGAFASTRSGSVPGGVALAESAAATLASWDEADGLGLVAVEATG